MRMVATPGPASAVARKIPEYIMSVCVALEIKQLAVDNDKGADMVLNLTENASKNHSDDSLREETETSATV